MVKIINTGTAYKISESENENLPILKSVEDIFLNIRNYIIKMPEPGSPVVACFSGGMDTVANVAILMEEFGLNVYPYFINRGQSNYKWEKEAVDFFNNYYTKRYPKLYNKYVEIQLDTPPKFYKNNLRWTKNLNDDPDIRKKVAYPARNPIIGLTGMEYAYSMQSNGIFPKTIFSVHTADDPPYHSALTAIRLVNLLMCHITNDYNWQFISIPIEKELGNYYGKEVYVSWCGEHDIPLEKSRSCYSNEVSHCGICYPACINRREAFKKAGLKDKTIYK